MAVVSTKMKNGKESTLLEVIDVASMSYSIDAKTGLGTKTGAADVARFLGSLETLAPGALKPSELAQLRTAFMTTYLSAFRKDSRMDRAEFADAEKWYALEMRVAVLRNDPSAKAGLLALLAAGGAP